MMTELPSRCKLIDCCRTRWAYGVVVSMINFHRSHRVSNPDNNVYDYTIVRHPWQISENHKPRVHPSHAREIGKSVWYLTKHNIEL